MRVLFASTELYSFAKAGGLADVSYSLPKSLKKYCEIYRVVPFYKFSQGKIETVPYIDFEVFDLPVKVHKTHIGEVETYLIYNEILCEKDSIYSNEYPDNYLRFAIFSKSIVELAKRISPQIIHINDWHTALSALYSKEENLPFKIVYTIHNMCYQGIFDSEILSKIGIDKRHFNKDELEFYSKVNFMKAGIAFADKVTTVSPSYKNEIKTAQYGCGLEGFIKRYEDKLTGILNGIDYDEFNPEQDSSIPYNFSQKNLMGKWLNKRKLSNELGLNDVKRPLFSFIGRLVEQKGIELLNESMEEILERSLNFIILCDGYKSTYNKLKNLTEKKNLYIKSGYDDSFSKRMYAASDFIIIPSIYEPCGLVQLIAFRYGTIPIAHEVGGLKDTINPLGGDLKCGVGFLYDKQTKEELVKSIDKAIDIFNNKKTFNSIRKFNMNCDFSADVSATDYFRLYKSLIE